MKSNLQQLHYDEHRVPVFGNEFIYARVYENKGPAIFLLHGFPDNIHLHDYLLPEIVNNFRVIVFDFLGWHKSSKPKNYGHTSQDQQKELACVINYFKATNVWLVAHDSSGPPAINYTLDNPTNVAKLVLMNTYYSNMSELGKPMAIWLYSTPVIRKVGQWIATYVTPLFHLVFNLQLNAAIKNKERQKEMVPRLYKPFIQTENLNAFFKLAANLNVTLRQNEKRTGELSSLGDKVLILYGAEDPNLNVGVASHFHRLIPGSQIKIIPDSLHYVQFDQPEAIAGYLLAAQKGQ